MVERPTYDEKLARILKEAAAVFAAKGYDRASIRDIAAATGVSLSGLYYYFKSKEELLFLIQEHCFGTILARLRADLEEHSDPRDRLALLIRNHLRFFANNMKEMKVLSVEADALSGEYGRKVAALKREYARIAQDIVETLPARGASDEGRPSSDERHPSGSGPDPAGGSDRIDGGTARRRVDPKVATFSLFGMLNWIYTWYRPGSDVPVQRLAEEMTHIFLEGALAPGVIPSSSAPEGETPDAEETSIWRT